MKILPKLLIITAVLLVLGGVGFVFRKQILSIIRPRPQEITLTYWGLFEPKEIIQPLIEQYEEENPHVTINYQQQAFPSFSRYKETLTNRLRQSTGPDIVRLHATWLPIFQKWLASAPSDIFSSQDIAENFYSSLSNCVSGGNAFCAPLMYDGLVLVYNKDLFAEAGIDSSPQSWSEFRETAVKLTKEKENGSLQAEIIQAGAAVGAAENVSYSTDIVNLMLAQSEVSPLAQLSSQASKDVFTFYTNFVNKDNVWDSNLPESVSYFLAGKVGMIFVPTWEVGRLEAMDSVDFGVAAVPQVPTLEDDLTDMGMTNLWVEGVSKNSVHSKEAWKFLDYLASADVQKQWFDNAVRMRGYAFAPPRKDLKDSLQKLSYVDPVSEYADNSPLPVMNSCSGSPDYVDVYHQAIQKILKGDSADTVLEESQSSLNTLVQNDSLGIEAEEKKCGLVSFGGDLVDLEVPELTSTPTPTPTPIPTEMPTPTPTPTSVSSEDSTEEEVLECTDLSATPVSGKAPLDVQFQISVSDSSLVESYTFIFGDGEKESTSSATVNHVYPSAGSYDASVTVEDTSKNVTEASEDCSVQISVQESVEEKDATPTAEPVEPGEAETGMVVPAVISVTLGILLVLLGFSF